MVNEPVFISHEMAVKGLKAAVELKGEDYVYSNIMAGTSSSVRSTPQEVVCAGVASRG